MSVVVNGYQAYPLKWPDGVPRSKVRGYSAFKTDTDRARQGLLNEVTRMGGKLAVISSNLKPRTADLNSPRGSREDPGVAIYFQRKGKSMVFACDRWVKVGDNLHALKLTIEALRGIERWGSAEMMEQAYSGFAQLPSTTAGESWWTILGVEALATADEIEAGYKKQLRIVHPDVEGGSHEAMQKLNLARDQARAVRR